MIDDGEARAFDRHGVLIGRLSVAVGALDRKFTRIELVGTSADGEADMWLIETENCGC